MKQGIPNDVMMYSTSGFTKFRASIKWILLTSFFMLMFNPHICPYRNEFQPYDWTER
jgi:hypothetical protein